MAKRLTIEEKTRRQVVAWLGIHGFYRFASEFYVVFNETELNDILINAVKEGMNKKWQIHMDMVGE